MAKWSVVHYNHDDVALGDVFPNTPEFAIYLGKVGYCNYEMDLGHPLAVKQSTEPYATDFKLFRDDKPIIGGLHTNVAIGDNIEDRVLKVSGKDWMHYFEIRFWPFDPVNPTANMYLVTGRDVFNVVKDFLDTILALSYSPVFTYAFGLSGNVVNYKIEQADTEAILSKITTLSQRSPGGFDIEVTHDREVKLYSPTKGIQRDLVLEQGANVYKLNYSNDGPKGTHTLAQSHVTSSRVAVAIDHVNLPKYRRIDYAADIPDLADASLIGSIGAGESNRAATPHTEFTATIVPDFIDDIFDRVSVGDTMRVSGDLQWDVIDDDYRLVSIVGKPDNEGNEEYELGFDDGTISL